VVAVVVVAEGCVVPKGGIRIEDAEQGDWVERRGWNSGVGGVVGALEVGLLQPDSPGRGRMKKNLPWSGFCEACEVCEAGDVLWRKQAA
jgi:hypothetical protein